MTTSTQSFSPADFVQLVIKSADDLREAGVQHLVCGEYQVTYAPPPGEFPNPEEANADQGDPDALSDQATFGGRMPTRRRRF